MRLNKKKLLLAFVCLVSIVLAYWTASVIAETYFFDKFFYFKSIEHGYWGVEQKFSRESFGERASDLIQLDKDFSVINSGERVLGVSSDEIYTIALIGDSYVWGQGVRFEDTVSQLLEKKLNQYKNTTVLSLGDSGDSILDFLMRYDRAKQTYPIDLYIFVLVQNDFLLKEDYKEKYKQMLVFRGCQDLFPEQEPVYDLSNNWTEIIIDDPEAYQEKLQEKYDQSLRSKLNLCILDHSLQALPTDNAIFFVTSYYHETDSDISWATYKEYLNKNQKTVLFARDAETLDDYKRFWKEPWKFFNVSPKDGHPSKIAHRMFTDILGNEILANSRWGF